MKLYNYIIISMFDLEFYKIIKLLLNIMIPVNSISINDIVKDDYILMKRKKDLRLKYVDNLKLYDYMNMYVNLYISYFHYDWYGKRFNSLFKNYLIEKDKNNYYYNYL